MILGIAMKLSIRAACEQIAEVRLVRSLYFHPKKTPLFPVAYLVFAI